MVIWKFPLLPWKTEADMPEGAQILSSGVQGDTLVVWAMVDPSRKIRARRFNVLMTGEEFKDYQGAFIATVQLPNGIVCHIHDRGYAE